MQSVTINAESFFKRVKMLQEAMEKEEFGSLAILNGKEDDRAIKVKISTMHLWLLGYEFPETLLIITPKSVHLLASERKSFRFLNSVEYFKVLEGGPIPVTLQKKSPDNNSEAIKDLITKSISESQNNPKFGAFLKEKQVGNFASDFESCSIEQLEAGPFFQEILLKKEDSELKSLHISGIATSYYMKKMIEEIENVIDDEIATKHSAISKKMEGILEKAEEKEKMKHRFGIDPNSIEYCYTPIIQSGGKYDLRPTASSNNDLLSYDTIVLSLGMKYKSYCSSCVRTLFIDATQEQKNLYKSVQNLHEELLSKMKVGEKLCDVYEFVVSHIKENIPEFDGKIPSNFGFGTGIDFKESLITISPKCDRIIEPGMAFQVNLTFPDLESGEKKYAIQICDTILFQSSSNMVNLNSDVPKAYDEISYAIQGDIEEKIEEEQYGRRNTRNTGIDRNHTNDNMRKEHQKVLMERKVLELQERLRNDDFKGNKQKHSVIKVEKLISYKTSKEIPSEAKKGQIFVDFEHSSVILPIYGKMVPFHISLIKSVSKHEEGRLNSLRFNFQYPGSATNLQFSTKRLFYIRELTISSKDHRRLNENLKKIKDLQKKVKLAEQEELNKEEYGEQESLQVNRGKRPALHNLKIRPNLSGKKTEGVLECHFNGFRYMTNKSEKIDIIFNNIKHAFFQPCDGEMIVLLHFHLNYPIMAGKKKTNDVQFYVEAGIMTEDLDFRKGPYSEKEEELLEHREKALRKRLNSEFESFVEAIESQTNLKVETPFRNLGFHGTPFRSNVLLIPTRSCLVALTETPFFVLTMKEIEIVHFERVQFGLKNFDMAVIFKDYEKPFVRICAIPMENIELIKNWLDKAEIIFTEGPLNLSWGNIMTQIRSDLNDFVETGGWSFLVEGSDDEDEMAEKELENDSAFEPSEEELGDEDSALSEDEEDDEDVSEFEEDSEEEEGLDWEELELRAEQEEIEKQKEKARTKADKIPQKKRMK